MYIGLLRCVFVVVLYKTFVLIFNPQEVWKSVWDRSAIKEWERDCMCDCGSGRCVYVEWGWFCCLVHMQRKSDPVFILTGNKWMIKIDIPTNFFLLCLISEVLRWNVTRIYLHVVGKHWLQKHFIIIININMCIFNI